MYETKESAACGSVAPSCGTSQLEVQEQLWKDFFKVLNVYLIAVLRFSLFLCPYSSLLDKYFQHLCHENDCITAQSGFVLLEETCQQFAYCVLK